ncbi:MAG: sel1 repeat family protein [Fuscovulum sp.]|nr:sel1 repeat family protein [Fuscovulum sp.]
MVQQPNRSVTTMFPARRVLRHLALALVALIAVDAGPATVGAAHAEDRVIGASGSAEGLYRQGVQLVYATNVVTEDTLRGVGLLERSADLGNVQAMLQLGSLSLYGQLFQRDWDKARSWFDKAAEAGDWSGLAQYGGMLMWSERNWREGQDLLEQAAERGITSAWVTLAEGATYGYLGGGRVSRAKYAGYAEKARAAGEPRIAVLEASRYQWGISVDASGAKAVEILREAADAGNAEAALALVNLLRDGNGQNVRRNPAAASAAMQDYAQLFSETEKWQLERALQAARARGAEEYAALAREILARGNLVTKDFGPMLMKANLNAAIYVLQAKLSAAGADLGAPDGLAGSRTLAAMYTACMKAAPPSACKDSVMRKDVIAALYTQR